jgi:hypothetical protein
MAGLSLAPPPPKWAREVPEEVWVRQLAGTDLRLPDPRARAGAGASGGADAAAAQPREPE